ncbi:MAG: M1 family metallopeptidase [Gammaproteobacteria bacterium]
MRALAKLAALAWVAAASVHADEPIKPGVDYHSFANVAEFRVKHVSLDLDVGFQKKQLSGHVDLTVLRENPNARLLVLDSRDLDIRSVSLVAPDGRTTPLTFRFGAEKKYLGRPLNIDMPAAVPAAVVATGKRFAAEESVVRIDYSSQPRASGLQWLTPAQTDGKKLPYLFSQSESVHARSWIPLQDSPQVRVTYDATIRVPKGLVAVMSAAHGSVDKQPDPKGLIAYRFEMREAIPSYLIAIAVGDIKFRAISARTGVYAEPGVIDAAAAEFSDLERMVAACETLFGPYRWGRYDILILPPSAPYGGMENPRLSFITPTVIAGDKSLVSLIAHELAHSWSGNLVTNATWRDFWLNEGFTVYLERRIVETLYGERRERMEDVLGVQSLRGELTDADPAHQQLAVDLRNDDPDDGVTDIAYEKGKLFLQFLENRFGREELQTFLRSYFDHFAFQSIYTEQFLDYLRSNLLIKKPGAVTEAQIQEWVYGPGLPAYAVLPANDVFAPVDAARNSWLAGTLATASLPARDWSTQEWLQFLNSLPADLPRGRVADLDKTFALSKSRNAEIAMAWFVIAIRADYDPAYPDLQHYLLTIGRRKLVRPLYEALMKTPKGAALALATYSQARPGYHPITATAIDLIVQPKKN